MTAAPSYPSWLMNGEWERPKVEKRTPRNPEFLTAREAAPLLRVSKNTMYRLIANGDIPHVRIGRTIRIPAEAVGEFIDGQLS